MKYRLIKFKGEFEINNEAKYILVVANRSNAEHCICSSFYHLNNSTSRNSDISFEKDVRSNSSITIVPI